MATPERAPYVRVLAPKSLAENAGYWRLLRKRAEGLSASDHDHRADQEYGHTCERILSGGR